MSRIFILLVVSMAGAVPALLRAQSGPAPDAVARGLQQHYLTVRDFSAEFTHTYRGGVLRTQTRESGTVKVKKPGRMRWIYTNPERKEFVSDGQKIYSYIPEDRQVIVGAVPRDDEASSPALFLAGKGDITRDFTASAAESAVPGAVAVKLTPKKAEPEYEFLIVSADPATFQIRALTTRDRQGGESTLVLTKLKENQGISDKEFGFVIPRGVDVSDNTRN
jgi:outer membrane lipoprotein carrier protein